MSVNPPMLVTLLLCDSAQVANGKLFVLGGGWNVLTKASPGPANMGLAVLIAVPWNQTNQRHRLRAELLTEDGEAISDAKDDPVRVEGEFEAGRPPGIRPGAAINLPIAANVTVPLGAGGYRWQVAIDGTVLAEAPFTVVEPNQGPPPAQQ